jgi:hypothetical protein
MASVRGILNIQSLIELSSENWIVHARMYTLLCRSDLTRPVLRFVTLHGNRGCIVSRMGFCYERLP